MLTKTLRAALEAVAKSSNYNAPFSWKPAAMQKLSALGFVEHRKSTHPVCQQDGWFITQAGRDALAAS